MWKYQGNSRPDFAEAPGPGQESVWDYPRPPALVADPRVVVVQHAGLQLAQTHRAMRVLETASPPTFYLPRDDVQLAHLVVVQGRSHCEWKGLATYWGLADDPDGDVIGWSYDSPNASFAAIQGALSFYPGRVECRVNGELVRPQPGGFYGGWITDEVVGPFKGVPGTSGW